MSRQKVDAVRQEAPQLFYKLLPSPRCLLLAFLGGFPLTTSERHPPAPGPHALRFPGGAGGSGTAAAGGWGGAGGGGRGAGCSRLTPLGGFSPQACRSPRYSRTRRPPSCPGSTAAAAKPAPCSRTRSCRAWRRGSRSSATCPRPSGWSWPRRSACPRRRWAGAGGSPLPRSAPQGARGPSARTAAPSPASASRRGRGPGGTSSAIRPPPLLASRSSALPRLLPQGRSPSDGGPRPESSPAVLVQPQRPGSHPPGALEADPGAGPSEPLAFLQRRCSLTPSAPPRPPRAPRAHCHPHPRAAAAGLRGGSRLC